MDITGIKNKVVWWIRRDFRIEDNAALFYALKENSDVIPVFIFDANALGNTHNKRMAFIQQSLHLLGQKLNAVGSCLLYLEGDPLRIFEEMLPASVYANAEYEPFCIKRDTQIDEILKKRRIPFKLYKDHVLFEKSEIVKDDGSPYTIYTPYSKKWKSRLTPFFLKSYTSEKLIARLIKKNQMDFTDSKEYTESSEFEFPERKISKSIIKNYHATRDFPAINGTTRLGVHLRFGTLSVRQLARIAHQSNETFLNELIWRDFFQMILWHFPHVVNHSFKSQNDGIKWRNDEKDFSAWCQGRTGYPLVDAGMRELNETGFMHNRVRMVAASFLTKNLLVDWRWGEAYFAEKLLDYELAANNGNWQWAAGCGCDAAPYFRIFNPALQAKRFDPESKYIARWVPELLTPQYPKPIIDYKISRDRMLGAYHEALKK